MRSVSLDCPHPTPVMALMMLSFALDLASSSLAWAANVRWGSRVTPRTLGLRQGGSRDPPRETAGSSLDWWESDVNNVTLDLGSEMVSPLSSAQVATHCVAWILRCSMTSAQRLLR